MRRLVLTIVLLAASLAVSASPGSAAPPADGPAVLTGSVTISGTQTGYVPVVLPAEARLGDPFFLDRQDSVTVTGGGRMAGFALVQDGLQGPVIFGGHSAASREFEDRIGTFVADMGPPSSRDGLDFVLPAGSYRLYLVTDGAPTTVTLRLSGLEGVSALAPTTPTQNAVLGGPMRQHAPGVYTAGGDTAMTGPFVVFRMSVRRTSVHTESVAAFCSHEGKPTGPDPYLPGCTSLDEGTGVSFGNSTLMISSDEYVGESAQFTWGYTFAAFPYHLGSGMSLTTASAVTDADYSHYFLGLDAPPPAVARGVDDSCPDGRVPEDGFIDVTQGNAHEAAIDCVVWWQVARGTAPLRYGPASDVTRGQMATFVANGITRSGGTLEPADRDWFSDDDGTAHEDSINRLAQAGIVSGNDGRYSPAAPVSRGQMAKFLVAAYEHRTGRALDTGPDAFGDDNGTTHEASINKAAKAGFTGGAAGGGYDPELPVRRDQLASYVVRLLDLLVEEKHAVTP